jgi:elongator complex protein 1
MQNLHLGGLSWRGDGEGLAVLSADAEDGITRVRMYSKQLELVSTGRNVADGPTSVMKGVGKVVAFATNGSYVAVCQEQKTGAGKNKLQVALVEKNGLRHGDFDLQLPPAPAGWERWEECSLDWDLPTTLLAVGLRAVKSSFAAEGTTDSREEEEQGRPGLVQLYYRGNYHWYLKQQWAGDGLRFLGFDEELVNRFYLSQVSGAESAAAAPMLRVVDLTWDISGSRTPDSSVAVVDGSKLLFTPLGINNIPPPMCKTSVALSADSSTQGPLHCTRSSCFWQPVDSIEADAQQASWRFAALAEDDTSILLLTGDSTGSILTQRLVDLRAALNGIASEKALQTMNSAVFRSIAVTQQGDQLRIVLLGSEPCALHSPTGQAGLTEAASDILLIASLSLSTLAAHDAYVVKLPTGSATRICAVPHSPFCVGVGIIRAGSDGSEFEVYRVNIESAANSAVELVATLPEQCTHLSFISDKEARGEAVPVALSLRNRLYCGESLLSLGVSSFCYNEAFGVMMFATLGTRPHLHFCSILRCVCKERGHIQVHHL